MKSSADHLLAAAKKIRLTSDEKVTVGMALGITVREKQVIRHRSGMGTQKFMQAARRISLTPIERAQIREGLLESISVMKGSLWFLRPFKHFSSACAALLIVVVASGSGVSYAAEHALPGELLYPVKVHVNEMVRTSMSRTREARAVFQTKRALRRLHEAKILAAANALDEGKAEQLRTLLHEHVDRSMDAIKSMEDSTTPDRQYIMRDFNIALRKEEEALKTMMPSENLQGGHALLMGDIRGMRMDIEELSMDQAFASEPDGLTATATLMGQGLPESGMAEKAAAVAELQSLDREEKKLQTQVRIRMARKRAEMLRVTQQQQLQVAGIRSTSELDDPAERLHNPAENDMIDIASHASGAEQLIDIATKQMESGDVEYALSTADMSLRHAEEGVKKLRGKMGRYRKLTIDN